MRASQHPALSVLLTCERGAPRRYELPILAGREPDATEATAARGAERAIELSKAVDLFILRRTNALLSAHLPPKVIQIVCCPLSSMQVRAARRGAIPALHRTDALSLCCGTGVHI